MKHSFTKDELGSFLTKTITAAKEQQCLARNVKLEIRWSGYVRALANIQQVIQLAEENLDEYDLQFSRFDMKEGEK